MNDKKDEFDQAINKYITERLASQQQELRPGDIVKSRDGREYQIQTDGSWRRVKKELVR